MIVSDPNENYDTELSTKGRLVKVLIRNLEIPHDVNEYPELKLKIHKLNGEIIYSENMTTIFEPRTSIISQTTNYLYLIIGLSVLCYFICCCLTIIILRKRRIMQRRKKLENNILLIQKEEEEKAKKSIDVLEKITPLQKDEDFMTKDFDAFIKDAKKDLEIDDEFKTYEMQTFNKPKKD